MTERLEPCISCTGYVEGIVSNNLHSPQHNAYTAQTSHGNAAEEISVPDSDRCVDALISSGL